MTTTFITIAIAAVFTALLILGLSITLIRKGHHIRGLKCATAEILEEERALGLLPDEEDARCTPTCLSDCTTCGEHDKADGEKNEKQV